MSEPADYQAWAMRAEEDYLLCRSALRRKVPLLYGATFHAQQCAEKYLKALLVVYGRAFPRTHDLGLFTIYAYRRTCISRLRQSNWNA
jgi:HEPN domain-containing protein